MRVLIDTNVVLDFLQEREPFVENGAKLFERVDNSGGIVKGYSLPLELRGIQYVLTWFLFLSKDILILLLFGLL